MDSLIPFNFIHVVRLYSKRINTFASFKFVYPLKHRTLSNIFAWKWCYYLRNYSALLLQLGLLRRQNIIFVAVLCCVVWLSNGVLWLTKSENHDGIRYSKSGVTRLTCINSCIMFLLPRVEIVGK